MKSSGKKTGSFKVGKDAGRVKVFVRVRPQRHQEASRNEPIAVTVGPDKKSGQIHVSDPKHSWEKTYQFDHVFPSHVTNSEVCSMISRPIVNSAMNGFNGTLMAYGQTGSGKTYTLMAPDGITASVIDKCFKKIALDERHDYKVTMAYLQIYQEKIYDLLNSNTKVELSIREHPSKGIYVENLSSFVVRCSSDVSSLMSVGRKRLVFAETKMNRTSSRSHSVCQLTIERTLNKENARTDGGQRESTSRNGMHGEAGHKTGTAGRSTKVGNGYTSKADCDEEDDDDKEDEALTKMAAFDNDDVLVRGNIHLCDLAGSERLKKTQAEGERLSEAQHINSSLLELGNVIQALAEGKKSHVPFRNSTLTRLLQESLGGNCKTSLMVCVAPSMCDVSETKCSLNFGSRAMKITTNAYVNVEVDYKRLSEDLNKLVESREKDIVEMRKMYEERILSITTDSETLLAEAIANSDKTLASLRSLYETQQTSHEEEIVKLQSDLESANKNYRNLKMQLSAFTRRVKRRDYQTRAVLLAEVMSMQLYCAVKSLINNVQHSKQELDVTSNEAIERELLPSTIKIMENSEMVLQLLKEYISLGNSSVETFMSSSPCSENYAPTKEEFTEATHNGLHVLIPNGSVIAETGVESNLVYFDESVLYIANKTDDDKVVESSSCTPATIDTENLKISENAVSRARLKLMKNLLEMKRDLDEKSFSFLSQVFRPPDKKSQDSQSEMNDVYKLLREMVEKRQEHANDEADVSPSGVDDYLSSLQMKENCLGHVLLDKALQCSMMVLEHYQLNKTNAALSKQIAQLKDEVNNMSAQNRTLQQATSSANNELEQCNRKLKENITGKEELADGINSMFHILKTSNSKSGECFSSSRDKASLECLRTGIKTLIEEKSVLQKERSDFSNQNERLENEVVVVKKKVELLRGENCSLHQELDSTSFKLEEATSNQKRLESCISEVFQLVTKNSVSEDVKESANDRVINGELNSKVSCVLKEKVALENDHNALLKDNETLKDEIVSLKNQINEVEQLKTNLDTELIATKARLEDALTTNEQNQVDISAIFELLTSNDKESLTEIESPNSSVLKEDLGCKGKKLFAAVNSLVETKTDLETKLETNNDHLQETIAMKEQLENDMSSIFQLFNMSEEDASDVDVQPLSTEEGYELSLEVSSIIETNQKLKEELCGAQTEREGLEKQLLIAKNEVQILKSKTKAQSRLSSRASSQESLPSTMKDLIDGRLQIQEQCHSLIENRKLLEGSFSDLHEEICKLEGKCVGSDNEQYHESENIAPTLENLTERSSMELLQAVTENSQLKDEIKQLKSQLNIFCATVANKESSPQDLANISGHVVNSISAKNNKHFSAQDQTNCFDNNYDGTIIQQALSFGNVATQADIATDSEVHLEEQRRIKKSLLSQQEKNENQQELLKRKEKELEGIRCENLQYREELSRLEITVKSAQKENDDVKNSLEEKINQLEIISAQKSAAEQENKTLLEAKILLEEQHGKKLKQLEQIYLKLKEENQQTKRLLGERTQQLSQTCARQKVLEQENAAILQAKKQSNVKHQEELKKLEGALSTLKTEEKKANFLLEESKKQKEEIVAQQRKAEQQIRNLLEMKSVSDRKHSEELNKFRHAFLTMKEENEKTKRLLDKNTKQMEQVCNHKKEMEREKQAFLKAKTLSDAQQSEEITKLKGALSTSNATLQETKRALQENTKRIEEILSEKKEVETEKKALLEARSANIKHSNKVQDLESIILSLKTKLESNKKFEDDREAELKRIHNEKGKLEYENKVLGKAVGCKQELIIKHEKELLKLKESMEGNKRLEKELNALEEEKEKFQQISIIKQKELESVRNQMLETERENKSLLEFKISTQQQLNVMKNAFEKELLEVNEQHEKCKRLAEEREKELLHLSDKLNSIDNFVRGIEAELSSTKEEKESYEIMLWSKDREFEDLKTNLASSKEQLYKLSEKLSTVTEECNCLKNELRVSESQRSLLQDQLKCLINLPELKKGETEKEPPDHGTERKNENERRKANSLRLENDNAKLREDLTLAKKTLLKLKEAITISNMQTRNLGSQLSSLRENSNQLEAELSTMRKQKSPRSMSPSTSDETLRLEMDLADSKQRVIDLQKKIIDVHNEKAVLLDRLSLAEVQLEKLTLALDTLLKDKCNTVVQLEGNVSKYKKEMKELESILAAYETVMNVSANKTLLKDQLHAMVKTTTAFKTQLSESNNKISVLEDELVKTSKQKDEMENELEELRGWTKSVSEDQTNFKQFAEMIRLKEELKRNLREENKVTSELEQSVNFYKKENERLQGKCNDLEKATCEKCALKNNHLDEVARVVENSRVDELREELQWYKTEKKRLEILLAKHNGRVAVSEQENDLSEQNNQETKRMENTSSLMQDKMRLEEEVSDLKEDKIRLESIQQLVHEFLSVEKQQTKLKRTLKAFASRCTQGAEENVLSEDETEQKPKNITDDVSPASKVLLRTLQEMEKENSRLLEENNSLKFRVLDFEKELEFVNFKLSIKEKSDHSGGRKALATVLASVKQQREELQKALDVLSGEKEDLEAEICALKVKSSRLQKELASSNLQKESFENELKVLRNKLLKVDIQQNNQHRSTDAETKFQTSDDTVVLPPTDESDTEVERNVTSGNARKLSHSGETARSKSRQNGIHHSREKTSRKDSFRENPSTDSRQKSLNGRRNSYGRKSIKRSAPSTPTSHVKSNTLSRSDENNMTILPHHTPDLIHFDDEPLAYTSSDSPDYESGLERVDPQDGRLPPEGMEDDTLSDTDSVSSSVTFDFSSPDDSEEEEIETMKFMSDQRTESEYFEDEEVIVKTAWSYRRMFWGQSSESQQI